MRRSRCAVSGAPIFVPHREQEVFKRLAALNKGPLSDPAQGGIWRVSAVYVAIGQ